ncbi:MAG: leucine-rich repeat domain-containing protein, partial [Methanobacteriota archaeon]
MLPPAALWLPNLLCLDISSNLLTDDAVAAVAGCTQLRVLRMAGNRLRYAANLVSILSGLAATLAELDVAHNPITEDFYPPPTAYAAWRYATVPDSPHTSDTHPVPLSSNLAPMFMTLAEAQGHTAGSSPVRNNLHVALITDAEIASGAAATDTRRATGPDGTWTGAESAVCMLLPSSSSALAQARWLQASAGRLVTTPHAHYTRCLANQPGSISELPVAVWCADYASLQDLDVVWLPQRASAVEERTAYRCMLLAVCPHLLSLDGARISKEERAFALECNARAAAAVQQQQQQQGAHVATVVGDDELAHAAHRVDGTHDATSAAHERVTDTEIIAALLGSDGVRAGTASRVRPPPPQPRQLRVHAVQKPRAGKDGTRASSLGGMTKAEPTGGFSTGTTTGGGGGASAAGAPTTRRRSVSSASTNASLRSV